MPYVPRTPIGASRAAPNAERMANRLAARPEVMDRAGSRRASLRFDAVDGPRRVPDCADSNVRGEFSLTALAYNMRRAINLVDSRLDCRRRFDRVIRPFHPAFPSITPPKRLAAPSDLRRHGFIVLALRCCRISDPRSSQTGSFVRQAQVSTRSFGQHVADIPGAVSPCCGHSLLLNLPLPCTG